MGIGNFNKLTERGDMFNHPEPGIGLANFEAFQFGQGKITDRGGGFNRAVQHAVMHQNQLAILGKMKVCFQKSGPVSYSFLKRGRRVFGQQGRCTPVGHNQGAVQLGFKPVNFVSVHKVSF